MYARRTVMKGVASLPLAAVLADPLLARAAAMGLDTVTLTTGGGKNVSAALALPAKTPAPAILMVHEWWGLNDQIKSVAAEFAKQGYVALAIDLYDGNVASTPGDARAYMQAVKPAEATDTLKSWLKWLKANDKVNGKLATIGWCFGGGWSLNASLAEPVDATVIYYGNVAKTAAELAPLKGPVLGHFADRDQWINKTMVGGFEAAMKTAGKSLTDYWYTADHAFANPTGGAYDAEDAKTAWSRTLDFLKKNLS